MKKCFAALVLTLLISLCGCSFPLNTLGRNDIDTSKSWSFQYNESTNDYSVFFGLCTKSGRFVSANVNIDIRIITDKDEEVYKETKAVSMDDFGNYTNKTAGDQFLANVRIPASDISSGSSSNGTVYLKVYKENVVSFDEVNCSALFCLPVKDIQLTVKSLPIELKVKGYDGSTESKIRVEDVSYTFEKDISSQLKITVSGTKTYGKSSSGYDIISYKLYDSKNYMIESGNMYLRSLTQGDKFQDDSIAIFDITPGESYTLKFSEYNY